MSKAKEVAENLLRKLTITVRNTKSVEDLKHVKKALQRSLKLCDLQEELFKESEKTLDSEDEG